ncbi:hypothetical protein [Motiliproteus sp. MSK22-1]|uniref:hypothetical protein n=1 Tax=Motiliproteus sp. MSK22-1 TaxID=1897630 RepID=UPI001E3DFC97|nr:hypothetical protein [Motiliproteus sp. MSK22-1]
MFNRCFPPTMLALLVAVTTGVHAQSFNRISSFPTSLNLPENAQSMQETSAEIITASTDGKTLIYSDSPLGGIGLVDISNIKEPRPAGFVALAGEPTSVATAEGVVLVGVNTSKS